MQLPANRPYAIICPNCQREIASNSLADAFTNCPFCQAKLEEGQASYRPALKKPATRKISMIILISFFIILLLGMFALFFIL